ncbi:MAG: bifunctional folylpolyglutamate synthase/dihydrofolate synthase [Alphaproteobacteria bacterium]|nr:MAG: bifunctional folylpolyglutamate synthase/dihydrofolate synthase [Alphaproteobacteria bacterium]TAF16004.1 MAG: bifunctional folylpolyglutamate synthase/dihydrofolate synthase [Alphaproteobacteria bacterium]TAF76223.1 MAG: bifunctional folylpolyglutamate synthase/dihydrofolate synthase [Alphaproteobacteria bacterium]
MLSYLSFWLRRLEQHPLPNIDLKLERMVHFLDVMGAPHRAIPPAIHIAGTNGKGSTTAFLYAMLGALGLKVHRYTSPHLVRFNERIVLAGEQSTDMQLVQGLEQMDAALRDCPLTYFESTTALAFHLFAQYAADVTLLEVGMGGRLDATNVIEKPLCTVITPVSYDHQEFLGTTLYEIAGEKAAIMKPHTPCIVGAQHADAAQRIEEQARRCEGVRLHRLGHEWEYHATSSGGIYYESATLSRAFPPPALLGAHQMHNASLALAVMDVLSTTTHPAWCDYAAWDAGISSASWAARLQRLDATAMHSLYGVDVPVFLDGGHNPDSAMQIAKWITQQGIRPYLIIGMHRDKDVTQVLEILAPHCAHIATLTIPDDPKAYDADALAEYARHYHNSVRSCAHLKEAMDASKMTESQNSPILIYGSLYLAGYVLGSIDFSTAAGCK